MSRLEYGQFLLSSQINYTQTYFAKHHGILSHDKINRWMRREKARSSWVWEHVFSSIEQSKNGYILFDDTVLDKSHSHKIELVRKQYSGNAHGIIKGIGVVNCVYVNPELNKFWIIDYRIFDPDRDGKSKLQHAKEMLDNTLNIKNILFKFVLMDSWYATGKFMDYIDKIGKIFYCPIKKNRCITVGCGYVSLQNVILSDEETQNGYNCRLKGMKKQITVQLFRVKRSTTQTELVITNDKARLTAQDVQNETALRWKIEQFHREIKQNTGIEACQCRNHRSQRTHIAVAILVWIRLNRIAQNLQLSIYNIKQSILNQYMKVELKSPKFSFSA